MNYLQNLRVLREAVANEPAPKLYLDTWRIKVDEGAPACGTLHCTAGLAATLPYFIEQGMGAHPDSGSPTFQRLGAAGTVEHFFGRYETPGEPYPDVGAMYCIFAAFECGEWDRELATAAGAILNVEAGEDYIDTDVMGHKKLALARLDKAIAYWEDRQNG